LYDIFSLLNNSEVPNLFNKEELSIILDETRKTFKREKISYNISDDQQVLRY
jgi:hypothetical protein